MFLLKDSSFLNFEIYSKHKLCKYTKYVSVVSLGVKVTALNIERRIHFVALLNVLRLFRLLLVTLLSVGFFLSKYAWVRVLLKTVNLRFWYHICFRDIIASNHAAGLSCLIIVCINIWCNNGSTKDRVLTTKVLKKFCGSNFERTFSGYISCVCNRSSRWVGIWVLHTILGKFLEGIELVSNKVTCFRRRWAHNSSHRVDCKFHLHERIIGGIRP